MRMHAWKIVHANAAEIDEFKTLKLNVCHADGIVNKRPINWFVSIQRVNSIRFSGDLKFSKMLPQALDIQMKI